MARSVEVTKGKYNGLLTGGIVSSEELDLAQVLAQRKNLDLETVLTGEFKVDARALGDALAAHFGVPYEPFKTDRARPTDLLKNFVREFCDANGWIPLEGGKQAVVVLAIDPDKTRKSKLADNLFPRTRIEYRVTTKSEFAATLDQMFGGDVADHLMLLGGLAEDEPLQVSPEIPAPISDLVYFSATAPRHVAGGRPFLLGIWAHLEQQRAEVLKQAQEELQYRAFRIRTRGPALVPRGAALAVRVDIPDFGFEDQDTILWAGQMGNCSFVIEVPKDAVAGAHIGTARIALDGMPVTRLHFEIEVGEGAGDPRDALAVREERPRSAFASYASENRDEVLSRIQGMQKLMPDLDVFLDIASLRSGENWARKLENEIARRDVFYLFWSSAARDSKWVENEWRAAIKIKGLDRIDPVPLESPDKVPPPQELASLHFNEWTLAYRKGIG